METLIQFCLDHLNYWTVMLFMTIESSFIPFPSEAVVPPAAWKAAVTGDMNVVLVVLFATLGALMGALINYFIALWFGRPIVYGFANSRIGHMCLIDEAKVQKAEKYFDEHGVVSTLIGRLVPVVRQLISIPAGLARMGLGRFVLYTTIGAGIWNVILAALGYYMAYIPGKQIELMKDGVIISDEYSYQTQFEYTALNDIKPAMVEEATRNARAVAQKFAEDSDCKLGNIKQATQGQFSITSDETTPQIKNIRVVTTVKYELK